MYAVAFDLVVADTERHHPKGVSQAYADINRGQGNQGEIRDTSRILASRFPTIKNRKPRFYCKKRGVS